MPDEKKPASDREKREQSASGQVQQEIDQEISRQPARNWRARIFQGYVILALAGFIALAVIVSRTAIPTFDVTITQTLQAYHPAWFFDFMVGISWFGYLPQAFIVTGVLILGLYIAGLRWEAVMGLFAAAGVEAVDLGVKLIVHRARPPTDLVHVYTVLHSYSFPSGHVMFYTGFFGFLWFLSYSLLKRSVWRALSLVFFGGLVILIGLSRVYLGEHWSSDVLGAYLLGSLFLSVSIGLYRWGKPRFFRDQPAATPEEE